ncbi:MAG: hypothetical protein WKF75_00815 [Singulisphaera sp.]
MMKTSIQWAALLLGLLLTSAAAVLIVFAVLPSSPGDRSPLRGDGASGRSRAILAVLVLILLNPVRVEETPGSVDRARWCIWWTARRAWPWRVGQDTMGQVLDTIRGPIGRVMRGPARRLASSGSGAAWRRSESPFGKAASRASPGRAGFGRRRGAPRDGTGPGASTDADTLLSGSSKPSRIRFGQTPPRAVVVFSDGRAHGRAGRGDRRGLRPHGRADLPSRSATTPSVATWRSSAWSRRRSCKSAQVPAQVYVRSYGYKGGGPAEARGDRTDGRPGSVLARTP